MPEALQSILPQFFPEGVLSCSRYGCGHINETYLVTARNGKRYILQKVSTLAFPDVKGLQENITAAPGPHRHRRELVRPPAGQQLAGI